MKKLFLYTIALLLLMSGWAWGATVYTKDIGGTVYYESGASSCDDVTTGDTAGDLEAALTAAGASGTLNVCAGTYSTTELDSDSILNIPANGQTINLLSGVLIANAISLYEITGFYLYGPGHIESVVNNFITVQDSTQIILSDLFISGLDLANPIYIMDSTSILIDRCIITRAKTDGITAVGTVAGDVDDLTIQYSLLTYCKDMGCDGAKFTKTTGLKIFNSTFTNNYGGGIFISIGTTGFTIKNSIFYNNDEFLKGYGAGYDIRVWGYDATSDVGYNCVEVYPSNAAYWPAAFRTNDVTTDPLFVSATDFNLKPGSPCRNAGTPNGSTPYSSAITDLNGNVITDASGDCLPRFGSHLDMGAYEWFSEKRKGMGNMGMSMTLH